MKNLLTAFIFACISYAAGAQTYAEQIEKFRDDYKQEFLNDPRSPLKRVDFKYLDFYAANESYRVTATFKKVKDKKGFMMQTHSGIEKHYYKYGKVTFMLHGEQYSLFIYQSENLLKKEGMEDYLFLPFTDATNNIATFGGCIYLDFKMADIKNNQLIIDFNKAYNPYCAFGEGYSCPIPPRENDMEIKIVAGEKLFLKEK